MAAYGRPKQWACNLMLACRLLNARTHGGNATAPAANNCFWHYHLCLYTYGAHNRLSPEQVSGLRLMHARRQS
jgi:hypothetical protein